MRKDIDDLYKQRKRICHENFHDASICLKEQAEVRAKKHDDLERQKQQSLSNCPR